MDLHYGIDWYIVSRVGFSCRWAIKEKANVLARIPYGKSAGVRSGVAVNCIKAGFLLVAADIARSYT